MTQFDLVEKLAERHGLTKLRARQLLEDVFAEIAGSVMLTGRFAWKSFGVWTARSRKARNIRNPQTNEIMKLKASRTIGFRAAKSVKGRL